MSVGSPTLSEVTTAGVLDPAALELAGSPVRVDLPAEVRARVERCRAFVLETISSGRAVYGASTGFGPLVTYAGRGDSAAQCDNAIGHLIAGHGELLAPPVARAAVLARLWSLCQGHSGVSVHVVEALVDMLATDFAPAVPRLGSVGASGDLVPLAHTAQALRGRGRAWFAGELMDADEALRRAGLAPVELDGRDALALVNGTSLTAAVTGLAVASAARSLRVAQVLSALLADVVGADPVYASGDLARAFGHPDVEDVAENLRRLLDGTVPSGDRPLQEPYSIRCTPQLLGSVLTCVRHADEVVRRDLNGVSDNPLFFPETGDVVHGGNFFGQPCAFAADQLANAVVQTGNLAERQLDLLIDPHRNTGLPPMLAMRPGEQHGVQGVQLTATATIVAMRRAATPASMQSVPTNLHNQDVVPFGTQAALTALDQARQLRYLHGALGLALRQAVHVGARSPRAPRLAHVMDALVDLVPGMDADRPLDTTVWRVADLLDEVA